MYIYFFDIKVQVQVTRAKKTLIINLEDANIPERLL